MASQSGGGCPGASTFYGWWTHAFQPWALKPMEPGTCHTDISRENKKGGWWGVGEKEQSRR